MLCPPIKDGTNAKYTKIPFLSHFLISCLAFCDTDFPADKNTLHSDSWLMVDYKEQSWPSHIIVRDSPEVYPLGGLNPQLILKHCYLNDRNLSEYSKFRVE